jgi:hypothetical protein
MAKGKGSMKGGKSGDMKGGKMPMGKKGCK